MKHEPLDFISSWGYGYCYGSAVKELASCENKATDSEFLFMAKSFIERGILNGEIGFRRVGEVSAISFVKELQAPEAIKEVISWLHRGIHMKQKQYILKAQADLEDYLSTVKLSSGDGKKNKD